MAVKIIRIPKTPASAFNARRPVSTLLKAQVANLEAAAYAGARAPAVRKRPRNEGQASLLIKTLTAQLHPEGAAAPSPADEARRLLEPSARTKSTRPAPRRRPSTRAGKKR